MVTTDAGANLGFHRLGPCHLIGSMWVLRAQRRSVSSRSWPKGSLSLPSSHSAIATMSCSNWFIQVLLQSRHTQSREIPLSGRHVGFVPSASTRNTGASRHRCFSVNPECLGYRATDEVLAAAFNVVLRLVVAEHAAHATIDHVRTVRRSTAAPAEYARARVTAVRHTASSLRSRPCLTA